MLVLVLDVYEREGKELERGIEWERGSGRGNGQCHTTLEGATFRKAVHRLL